MLNNVPMLRAGDVLIVAFAEHQPDDALDRFTEQVQECLPGVRVAVMEGVSGLAAFRPGCAESTESKQGGEGT
jgi:hypothetical protein